MSNQQEQALLHQNTEEPKGFLSYISTIINKVCDLFLRLIGFNKTPYSKVDLKQLLLEKYGETIISFGDLTYLKALNEAKKEAKVLVVILLCFENEDNDSFCKNILCCEEFKQMTSRENVVLYINEYTNSYEATEVGRILQVNKYPNVTVIGLDKKNETKLKIIKRFEIQFCDNTQKFNEEFKNCIDTIENQLKNKRQKIKEDEFNRQLLMEQQNSFQKSLLKDKIKKQEKEDLLAKRKNLELTKKNKKLYIQKLTLLTDNNEENLTPTNSFEFSFKLLNGKRIKKRFSKERSTVKDLYDYALVCLALENNLKDDFKPEYLDEQSLLQQALPEDYLPSYEFNLVTIAPRKIVNPLNLNVKIQELELLNAGNIALAVEEIFDH